eukprot:comp7932_c0_seq1/m.8270 comp7932_c0_seq1/g.8270  ORF comp7932_c0_seq1/g.8270 comp7932_c0_seq1/m.8270 type:complete len:177 (-) comp7932_c0_seq1:8-538(-)
MWFEFDFRHKIVLLYLGLLGDIIANNIFDPPYGGFIGTLVAFFFQASIILFVIVVLLLLFKTTYLFKTDMSGLIRVFRWTIVTTLVNFFLLIVVRLFRIFLLLSFYSEQRTWQRPGFFPLYVIQKIVAILYYLACYQTSIELANPKYYRKIVNVDSEHAATRDQNHRQTAELQQLP